MDHTTAMTWMTKAEAEVVFEYDEDDQDGEAADGEEVAGRATSEAKHTTGKAATRATDPREKRSRSRKQKRDKYESSRRRSRETRGRPSDIPRSSHQGHREQPADLARRGEVATPEFQMQPGPIVSEGTVTVRRGEMQMILDSVKRASLNARNAERLSDSAAVAFRQEAIALEAAGAYLTQFLMR